MKIVSSITAGTLIAAGAVIAPSLNFVPSYATVGIDGNTVEATETFEGVRLEWELSDPQASIQILNNGEIVADADSSGSTVDLGALEGVAEYQVVVEEPAEIADFGSDVPEDIEDFAHVITVPLTIGEEVGLAANASGNTPVTTFRYQTFISDQYVAAPSVCTLGQENQYFVGDDRSWSVSSPDNRTRFDVQIDWRLNGTFSVSKFVGETVLVKPNINGGVTVINRATASSDGMKFLQTYRSSTAASFNLKHEVSNPLCAGSAGIYYNLDVKVWKGSGYAVDGVIRKVPNHAFYVKDSDETSWEIIWQKGYSMFGCLNPFVTLDPSCYLNVEASGPRW